jgi:hypothetical protein
VSERRERERERESDRELNEFSGDFFFYFFFGDDSTWERISSDNLCV